jgi:hypothetical protein
MAKPKHIAATHCATDGSLQALVNPGPAAPHRFDVIPIGTGGRGPRYDVTCGGIVVSERTTEPALDGSRGALGLAISGMAETWHVGAAYASMRFNIATAARLTVIEGQHSGPRFTRWQPFDDATQRLRPSIAESGMGQGTRSEGGPPQP